MTTRYSHVFSLGLQFETTDRHGAGIEHAAGIRRAILQRLASLDDAELLEAIGDPEHTAKV